MGHDISAYKINDNTKQTTEVAYLRRGAGNHLAREIYKCLNVTHLDGGCSGIGQDAYFTQDMLVDALRRLPDEEDLEPEKLFLANCIQCGESVVIMFG